MLLYKISTITRDEGNFERGSIIWNTTEGQLQAYTGNEWIGLTPVFTPTAESSGGLQSYKFFRRHNDRTNGNVVFLW